MLGGAASLRCSYLAFCAEFLPSSVRVWQGNDVKDFDEVPPSVDIEEVLAMLAQDRNMARKVSVMQTAGLSPMSVPRPIKLVDTPPHTRPSHDGAVTATVHAVQRQHCG
ncbi:hypothetical protein DIPPA_03856 [Diplonema papillatum]|nr:hypothetical protein DIPPA_03856 [Diplonema papillatum]